MWSSLDTSLAIGIFRFDKEYEIECRYKFSNSLVCFRKSSLTTISPLMFHYALVSSGKGKAC